MVYGYSSFLLRTPPDRFARIVPFLVLGATLLFLAQGPIMRRLRERRGATTRGDGRGPRPALTGVSLRWPMRSALALSTAPISASSAPRRWAGMSRSAPKKRPKM